MASGASVKYHGSFVGQATEISISKIPFQPRVIRFWGTGGIWGVKIAELTGMDGSNYLSNTAADVGCTIDSDGFTLANGADVNDNGNVVYYECED